MSIVISSLLIRESTGYKLPNREEIEIINLTDQGSSGTGTERMFIITEGEGEEQSFLIVLPPSLTNAMSGGTRIKPMVVRL